MRDWRLLALDMDGTLLSADGGVSRANRTWIRRAQAAGIAVTFATGRPFSGQVESLAREFELHEPLVTLNGGALWTPDGELWEEHPFSAADVEAAREAISALPLSIRAYTAREGIDGSGWRADGGRAWVKFVLGPDDPDILRAARERLEESGRFAVTSTHPHNLEVNPRGVSKAAGLRTVCGRMGIEARQLAAVGDSLNDVEMLRFAGVGVAMGNAGDEVKAAADRCAPSCAKDGVAHAIRALLAGEW